MAVFQLSKRINLVKAWRCLFRHYGAVRSGGETARMTVKIIARITAS
jgi:hypothetical protein